MQQTKRKLQKKNKNKKSFVSNKINFLEKKFRKKYFQSNRQEKK